ncbi:MAG: thiolase family protein, partial [Pseudomonadota bacterium]
MASLRGKVALVGAADTAVGSLPDRSPMELCVEAALSAIEDAGLTLEDVDGVVTCNAMAQP